MNDGVTTIEPPATVEQPEFDMNPLYDYVARINPITGRWELAPF